MMTSFGQESADEITRRRDFSSARMAALRDTLATLPEVRDIPELCIYVTGSYGRGDASPASDVDIFFLRLGHSSERALSRVDKTLADAAIIKACRELGFPEFTQGGIYLDIHYVGDMQRTLGSREDDYRNHFTARMLLLLESVCVYNPPIYEAVIRDILQTYFRDFADHADTFRPVFLLNDLLRYWKTMCLNYEARRTGKTEASDKLYELAKNFRLKYSRLLICFSMIAPLIAAAPGITLDDVSRLVHRTPTERLREVAERRDAVARRILERLLSEYAWFLTQTADKEALLARFADRAERQAAFARAATFGDLMYSFVNSVKHDEAAMRYLLV